MLYPLSYGGGEGILRRGGAYGEPCLCLRGGGL
jgi:hypothetical protein